MSKRWRILNEQTPQDPQGVVAELLKNRGISDPDDFFSPPAPPEFLADLKAYLPDFKEGELKKSAARIKKALKQKEKIVVWGDYDVDGVASTAILWRVLFDLGANVVPYIPDRFKEGYGLNIEGLKRLKEEGASLVVTVDSGITAVEQVAYANSLGLEVVITDHHVKGRKVPPAYAVVHSTLTCGAPLSWILAAQLADFSQVEKELDLVALAVIADLQPVVGANRILLKAGFKVLNRLNRPGLAALAESAGLQGGFLGSYAAGWVLGPRLNAAGRLKDGMEALRLVCTKNLSQAKELADSLGAANAERKKITEEIAGEARLQVGEEGPIVVHSEGWHEGVIGLVAGQLVREYGRPAVVISAGEEFSKGSARSVNGLNIIEALQDYRPHLIDLGGHAAAAGFTLETANLAKFLPAVREGLGSLLRGLDTRPVLKADLRLPLNAVSFELAQLLSDFEPIGLGNPAPLFLAEGAEVISSRSMGKDGKHLSLQVSPGLDVVWFGAGAQELLRGERVSFLFTPEIRRYLGKERLSLRVADLKKV
ncbi:MAG: Single-stranded-DNA-specific exonuclease RecJ [candidate division CPR1 bacterium GW2011_GWC1_49_13]|uniref:Single-stranded-DNA-specific exonuclease RecJ n=1 Tax=candidate division CPR1 bacterium GW2011_GWC1_49_13 TaxID=1618342 RepID=A0A0G1VHN9_9BACT|nr:MAG: Single-stranded-DNA-specific exonuclease RecJ [candidate division CPR1 bacterium GW2011_GWC1_49_13]